MADVPDAELTPAELAARYWKEARGIIRHWHLQANSPGSTLDDMLGDAGIALMDLATKWDSTTGASFKTYMHNTLVFRTIDVVRKRYGRVLSSHMLLTLTPEEQEAERRRRLNIFNPMLLAHSYSAEPGRAARAGRAGEYDPITGAPSIEKVAPPTYDERADEMEALEALGAALGRMEPRNRLIVHLRMQGMTLGAIGEQLGVTESRICQLVNGPIAQALRNAGFSC